MTVAGHHVPVWYDEASGPTNGQGVFWNATTGRWEAAAVDTSALDAAGLATDAALTAGLAAKQDTIPPGTYVDTTTAQTVAGNKDFTGTVKRNGVQLARVTEQMMSLLDPRIAAALDGAADDTGEVQVAVDFNGSTATLRGGGVLHPGGRARLTDTVVIDRKTIVLAGVGHGTSGGGGSLVVWDGIAGLPMVKVRRCENSTIKGLRFVGNSTAKPSAAVNLNNQSGDSPYNTRLRLENLWVGHASSWDADAGFQFTDGILVDGHNAQNDQSGMEQIYVTGCEGSAIKITGTQAVLWSLKDIIANGNAIGVDTSGRFLVGMNWFFSSHTTADIKVVGDGTIDVLNFGSETSARCLLATAGVSASIRRGYWQANDAVIAADGAVFDLTASGGSLTLRLEDFNFTRKTPYAGPQETIKVRNAKAYIVLDNVTIPGPPATVLDLTTANAGESRHVILRNVVDALTGTVYNGQYRWTHGDTVPNLNANTFLIDNGTAALPGLTFPNDPDTGIYRSAANTLNIVAAGANVLQLSNSVIVAQKDIRPAASNSTDLGVDATRWRTAYLAGKVLATGGLGVGNSAAATTPGTVVKKMQVFDASGTSLGYVAVYDAIT